MVSFQEKLTDALTTHIRETHCLEFLGSAHFNRVYISEHGTGHDHIKESAASAHPINYGLSATQTSLRGCNEGNNEDPKHLNVYT